MRNKNLKNRIHYKDNILKKIRGFCFVMKYQSITKAARFLYLTQPAVSFQIQSLEKDLKLQLFKKEKNKIIPTKDAYRFYNLAQNALFKCENLYQDFFNSNFLDFNNEIKIAGNKDYISQIAIDILNKINIDRSLVKIKLIQIDKKEELIDLFIRDFVDIIGIDDDNFQKLTIQRDDFVEVRKDFKIYGMLVKRKDFYKKKTQEIYNNIKNMNFIYNEKYNDKIKYFFKINNLQTNLSLDTDNIHILENLIENNYGYAFCSMFNIKKISKLKNNKLRFVKISSIKKDIVFSICKKNNPIVKLIDKSIGS